MKKILLTSSAFIILILTQSLIMKKDGAAPGYTGSPGDSLKNCTACHGGTAYPVDNWLSSNIPTDGYVPGQTYIITATNNESGATRFGFEVSPQDSTGKLLGTIVVTDALRTKLVGDDKYITYTENGVQGQNSLSWSFNWVAPSKEVDEVTFYGAFNSNFDGHKGGDQTYLSTLTVKRNKNLGVHDYNSIQSVKIYPNPTYDYIELDANVKTGGRFKAEIVDMNGRQVSLLMDETVGAGACNRRFDIDNLANGHYLVRLHFDGKTSTQRLSISR